MVYLDFGKTQVKEVREVDREHDGEEIVFPGENGYRDDSGWENLGEDIEEEDSERQGGGAEVHGPDGSGQGDERHGGNVVTPRNKRARLEIEGEINEQLEESDNESEDSDSESGVGVGFGFK